MVETVEAIAVYGIILPSDKLTENATFGEYKFHW